MEKQGRSQGLSQKMQWMQGTLNLLVQQKSSSPASSASALRGSIVNGFNGEDDPVKLLQGISGIKADAGSCGQLDKFLKTSGKWCIRLTWTRAKLC